MSDSLQAKRTDSRTVMDAKLLPAARQLANQSIEIVKLKLFFSLWVPKNVHQQ